MREAFVSTNTIFFIFFNNKNNNKLYF